VCSNTLVVGGDFVITILKIAEICGVSRGTVDRVLNNRGKVKPEVEAKIKKIANDLCYKPNSLAKALVTRKKKFLIGIILNSVGNYFYDDVIDGIQMAQTDISDYGITVIMKKAKGYNVETQLRYIDELIKEGANAIAITPINDVAIAQKLNSIATNIPIVTLNNDIEDINRLAFIGTDYLKSGKTAGELLGKITDKPCDVGIITGSVKILGHNKRIQGFTDAISSDFKHIAVADIVENNDDEDTSYVVTKELLLKNSDIAALYFTAGGVMGGINAACELGLAHKLKIITFDATPVVKKNIANGVIDFTICQQPFKQGYTSIKVLSDYLVSGTIPEKENIFTDIEIKLKNNI
jgi:LacI family transcriptional regulator